MAWRGETDPCAHQADHAGAGPTPPPPPPPLPDDLFLLVRKRDGEMHLMHGFAKEEALPDIVVGDVYPHQSPVTKKGRSVGSADRPPSRK
jgi:hypothetical protein